ncbi:DUF2235 domain-containing protein [Enterovirga aerilata]|uniref:DUF2235 domain-containing protein n=1 Tax=Enterovirga aerilata TaxID=2730920 RepID=A0A849IDB3_9HYPH|nr:DUF2235 domain-containing protein [Enterovirga sp. DB1703]NNM74215.1 DUF2235 domain-containing protein [Enterovirga sp. DB1703]
MPKNIVVFSDGTGQDGGTRPEQRWSNIFKMYRASRVAPDSTVDPRDQVVFYDPGLGTETSATGWTNLGRRARKLLANVDGRGIAINIADCYEFIINHYRPGDRIFLFGFSRGAYTVRSVANLIMLCGVPTKDADRPLPRFRRRTRQVAEEAVTTVLEHGAGHPRGTYESERLELARRFRETYGSHHEPGEEHRSNAAPYFIGVFDTVAALGAQGALRTVIQSVLYGGAALLGAAAGAVVGGLLGLLSWGLGWSFLWVFAPTILFGAVAGAALMRKAQRGKIVKTIRDFPNPGDVKTHVAEWKGEHFDRLLSRFVTYARSANAIDETRADFARVGWANTVGAPESIDGVRRLRQVWFAGNHSDVGGSYPETESRLSDIALEWMITEALSVPEPLRVGPVIVNGVPLKGSGDAGPALFLHPAENGLQHCEVAGMEDTLDARVPSWLRRLVGVKGWRVKVREIKEGAELHPSVAQRFSLPEVPQCAGHGPYRPSGLKTYPGLAESY